MSPRTIITLDLSKNCGACWTVAGSYEPDWAVWMLDDKAGRPIGQILAGVRNFLADLIERLPKPVTMYVEQRPPAFRMASQTQAKTTDQQAFLEAICLLVAYDEGVPVEFLNARHVRSKMISDGAKISAKDKREGAIVKWCQSLGYRVFDDNAADALLMWLYVIKGPQVSAGRARKQDAA